MTWKKIISAEQPCLNCGTTNWEVGCIACGGNDSKCSNCNGTNKVCGTCRAKEEHAEGLMDDARSDRAERERIERDLSPDKEELYQELQRFRPLGQ